MGETTEKVFTVATAYSDARRTEDAARTNARFANVITLTELLPYGERYNKVTLEPLVVTAITGNSPLVVYDLLHLDGLLSYAVMMEATSGTGPGDDEQIYYCPLPVMRLWSSKNGLPLWAASDLFPTTDSVESTVIYHQRFLEPTRTGRFMDKRIPKPVVVSPQWKARCFGNAQEVKRLLNLLGSIGKHRHDGMGRVKEWRIEQGEFSPGDTLIADEKLMRPLPEMALHHFVDLLPRGNSSLVAWTPPYWKRQLFNFGWRTGTRVHNAEIDYFNGW